MPIPTESRQVVRAPPPLEPSGLARRCRADALRRLAVALGVPKAGPKAALAARIVARAQLLERLLFLGDDPVALARTFRAESLRRLGSDLGVFLGVPKYGLAVQLLGGATPSCGPSNMI